MTNYSTPYSQSADYPIARPASTAPRLPVEDWVRDIGAALLLLVSLALPWTAESGFVQFHSTAGSRVDVLLVTLVVAFGASLTFLMRGGVFGALSVRALLWIRLAVISPYLILVLVYLLLDATATTIGLGTAAAVGLAGVALIGQPRRSEIERDPSLAPRLAAGWRFATIGVLALIGLTAVVAVVFLSVNIAEAGRSLPVADGLRAILLMVVGAAIPIAALTAVLRGSEPLRIIAAVATSAILPIIVISALADHSIVAPLESLRLAGYIVLWMAFTAGILWSPALALSTRTIAPLQKWFAVASHSLVIVAVSSGFFVLVLILGIIGNEGREPGVSIAMLVLCAAGIAVALLGRARLRVDPARSRAVVIGLAAAATAIGSIVFIIAIVVTATGSFAASVPALFALVGVLTPGALTIVALTAPVAVRGYFAQFAPASMAYSVTEPAAAGVAPALHPAANPLAPAEELAAWAADPLAWIHLAGNPATYPALLEWLAQVGDEPVQQVLRARPR